MPPCDAVRSWRSVNQRYNCLTWSDPALSQKGKKGIRAENTVKDGNLVSAHNDSRFVPGDPPL
jgi:hypothetical protein